MNSWRRRLPPAEFRVFLPAGLDQFRRNFRQRLVGNCGLLRPAHDWIDAIDP